MEWIHKIIWKVVKLKTIAKKFCPESGYSRSHPVPIKKKIDSVPPRNKINFVSSKKISIETGFRWEHWWWPFQKFRFCDLFLKLSFTDLFFEFSSANLFLSLAVHFTSSDFPFHFTNYDSPMHPTYLEPLNLDLIIPNKPLKIDSHLRLWKIF